MMRALLVLALCSCAGAVTGGSGGGDATGGGTAGGSSGGGDATGGGAATGGGSTGGGSAGGGTSCPADAGPPMATGTTRGFDGGMSLQALIAASAPGDRVRIAAGTYGPQTITAKPAGDVFVEGTGATFAGLTCNGCTHLYVRGLAFTDTVSLDAAAFITLDGVSIDVGTADKSALYIHGRGGAADMAHDITVVRSSVHGGARTVFIATNFSVSANWNHHLVFSDDDFVCGSHNCFQLSGARDTRIEANHFHDPRGSGVLTAGATRVEVLRNRMRGDAGMAAVQLATPGQEWDDFAGVEHMLSTEITVANNVMTGWGTGIELDAAKDLRIVFNTVVGGVGLHTWHRSPTDQQDNVILVGNQNYAVWNNILPSVQIDSADPMPTMIGTNLVGGSPMFVDQVGFQLAAGSTAIDRGAVTTETPTVDFLGYARGSMPDYGALERGAVAPVCP